MPGEFNDQWSNGAFHTILHAMQSRAHRFKRAMYTPREQRTQLYVVHVHFCSSASLAFMFHRSARPRMVKAVTALLQTGQLNIKWVPSSIPVKAPAYPQRHGCSFRSFSIFHMLPWLAPVNLWMVSRNRPECVPRPVDSLVGAGAAVPGCGQFG
jgi:hypothetical protein